MSISTHYSYVREAFPSRMIMPLQDALTCSLPSTSGLIKTHNPFPGSIVEIRGELSYFSQQMDLELIIRNRG
jgi:serine/threonine-protein kinase ATR